MARALLKRSAAARDLLEQAEQQLDFPISDILARGPAKLLNRTDYLQPSICLVSAMALTSLNEANLHAVIMAGHSLGELTACYAAGMYDFQTLLHLARKRGSLMQAAADRAGGGMLALTLREGDILEQCQQLLQTEGETDVCIANINSPHQVALSGSLDGLIRIQELARAKGIRTTPLPVSGPWHSPAMQPAADAFAEEITKLELQNPHTPILVSGHETPLNTAKDLSAHLARQITAPVDWLDITTRLRQHHASDLWLELAPGKILTGLLLDTDRNAQIYRCETDAQMKRLNSLLEPTPHDSNDDK